MLKGMALDVPDDCTTLTFGLPAEMTRVEGTLTTICVELTEEGVNLDVPNCTVESEVKPEPLMVNWKPAPPANEKPGYMESITAGDVVEVDVTVNVAAFEVLDD
jgi:hypothetical protein